MPPSSAAAYQSLQGYKARDTQSTLKEAEQKYGIPERQTRLSNMRGLVGNLQSSVEAVDPSVTGRTSGTFTTEGQRQALVNRERAPILTDLSKQQQALGIEQAGFSEAQSLAGQMASALLNQDQQTYQRLLDQYNVAKAAEQEAEQKRQWEQQQAEARRQFDLQMAETQRQYDRGGYDIQAIIDALSKEETPVQTTAQSQEKPIVDASGRILGYDTPTQSFLTDAGQAVEDEFWRKQNSGWSLKNLGSNLSSAFSGAAKNVTGIFGRLF